MTDEELHDVVDIERIEPTSVKITDAVEEAVAAGQPAPARFYTVAYSLPIKVSKTWQYMFQRPDPMSGAVHQVNFEFSKDGREVFATLKSEPPPELILVLRTYVDRANRRWKEYKKSMMEKPADTEKPSEEERILRKLKDLI